MAKYTAFNTAVCTVVLLSVYLHQIDDWWL